MARVASPEVDPDVIQVVSQRPGIAHRLIEPEVEVPIANQDRTSPRRRRHHIKLLDAPRDQCTTLSSLRRRLRASNDLALGYSEQYGEATKAEEVEGLADEAWLLVGDRRGNRTGRAFCASTLRRPVPAEHGPPDSPLPRLSLRRPAAWSE